MKHVFTTKRICRAGIIAALYVVLTYVCMPFAFGPFQFRPAEAFCILPLLFPEIVPALFIGCAISNLTSPYLAYDLPIGSAITLLAAVSTYFVGKYVEKDGLRIFLGGLLPVLLNAVFIPFLIVFLYGDTMGFSTTVAYFCYVGSMLLTQSISVYGLGTPLYFAIRKNVKRK